MDSETVKKYEEFANDMNAINAQYQLDLGKACASEGNTNEAIKHYQKAADLGNSEAKYILAVLHLNSASAEHRQKGFSLLKDAADGDYSKALALLGSMYCEGDTIPSDYSLAEKYLTKAINSPDCEDADSIMFDLAMMYSQKTKEYDKAFSLWRTLAEKGDTASKYNLGIAYKNGAGTAVDLKKALYWWEQAAADGDEDARLGVANLKNIINNQNNTQTAKSGCYIATAVYGSYDCPEVWALRRFRDQSLSSNCFGKAFIKIYYAISPTLVKWFGKTKWFNTMCKKPLDKLVSHLISKGFKTTPYFDY